MRRVLTIAAGRRAKWVIAAAWLLVVAVTLSLNLPAKFSDAEKNESTSFLPGDAESTKELAASKRLQKGELAPMVIAYRRASGLTAADRQRVAQNRAELNSPAFRGDKFTKTSPFA